MAAYSAAHGARILRRWDIRSGSELQLSLERRTYLVSTVLAYALGFQLASLFLFVYTADAICSFFVGAMCAAGTLHVNAYGYPALALKTVNFLLAGVWLVLNHADNRAEDYPLVRRKYALLLAVAPMLLLETVLVWMYFLGLRADVITSCCGSLFTAGARGVASELSGLPVRPAKAAFYLVTAATLWAGVRFRRTGKGGYLFAVLAGSEFVVSLVAIVSFISLYVYQLPTHHCPFCILQGEYGYIGYPLYLSLLLGALGGLGVGAMMPFRAEESLRVAVPALQRRLALVSVTGYGVFAAVVTAYQLLPAFRLEGY
jgi:hypothetical protein